MKAILVAFLCIVSMSALSIIDGTWNTTMEGPGGEMKVVFLFKTEGEKLSGSVTGPMGDMPISNGKITDKAFSFDVEANGMVINHDCTIKDDNTIAMKTKGSPMGDSELILKRQTP